MKDGFIKAAAASPEIRVADCDYNADAIINSVMQLAQEQVKLAVFPELCITGYTCGDLFLQKALLDAAERAVRLIACKTCSCDIIFAVGAPISVQNRLYNCAVIINRGKILGIIPKSFIPNYSEFYELRHFSPAPADNTEVRYAGQSVLFGTDLLFYCETMPELCIAAEICEDLWVPQSPSVRHCKAGANIIINLSASDETIGKAEYRRKLISMQSAKLICGYIYADASIGESTTDMVFAGHKLIAENGTVLAQSKLFDIGCIVSELDVQRLNGERRRMNTFCNEQTSENKHVRVPFSLDPVYTALTRFIAPNPFVPNSDADRDSRCDAILSMQAHGLAKRITHTHARSVVIGVSGGLDSTLALLVAVRSFELSSKPVSDIIAVTMPCFGTTKRTKSNAERLCELLGVQLRCIDIAAAVKQHFSDIGHDPAVTDVVYENSQARERTQILMDIANQSGGFVIGTGDLSELALGWATYNGDHMSGYGVNASIPKTLVRHIVGYFARTCGKKELSDILSDILDTPVSPELLPPAGEEISQQTEDIVGPYELHDFFLYYFVRFGFSPEKIRRLAIYSWQHVYSSETIDKWLSIFLRRFFAQQFKRSCLPDGPKVGSVTLSPRGDWRMPSDACSALWLKSVSEECR